MRAATRATPAVGTYKLASVLLQYPTAALFDGLDVLEAATSGCSRASREAVMRFLAWLRATAPTEVAQHYVQTFDLRRRCALYLTYYRYGDTRKRGMAMLRFKSAYRRARFEPSDQELPDYLPLVLEFAALTPSASRFCAAPVRTWNCYAERCTRRTPRTRTSSMPSAPSCRSWASGS